METVKIKLLSDVAKMPRKATVGSAAYDLYTPLDFCVASGRSVIPTGVALEMPQNICATIRSRSGFAAKGFEGVSMSDFYEGHVDKVQRFNCDVLSGLIDSDYRDGVGIIVNNHGPEFVVPAGTRIAQLKFEVVPDLRIVLTDELNDTERGTQGFGHSGTK